MKKKYESPSISIIKIEVAAPITALSICTNLNWTTDEENKPFIDFTWEDGE